MSEKINKSASDSLGDVVITMYKVENLDSGASYTTTGQKLGISTAPNRGSFRVSPNPSLCPVVVYIVAESFHPLDHEMEIMDSR